jgi:predicted metal-binding protein
MPTIEIDYDDIVFDKEVQQFCNNDQFQCPNYHHSWGCPPEAPYLEEKVAEYTHHLLVYIKEDINRKGHNNLALKEKFEREMLSTAEKIKARSADMHLLWGGHCTLCKRRLDKRCTYDANEPCRFPDEIRYSMEAVGINVDATVKNVDIHIEWPPTDHVYKFGLISYNLNSQ